VVCSCIAPLLCVWYVCSAGLFLFQLYRRVSCFISWRWDCLQRLVVSLSVCCVLRLPDISCSVDRGQFSWNCGSPLNRVSSEAVDVIGVCTAMLLISCRRRIVNCLPLSLCSCCCQKLFQWQFL
jgi:hypothetical protein